MKLIYNGQTMDVEKGMTYLDIAKKVQSEYDATIILAKIDQNLIELGKEIVGESIKNDNKKPLNLTFITTKDSDGHKTYKRGATMMFLRAMTHVFGERIKDIKLEHSLGDNLFFTFSVKNEDNSIKNCITDDELALVKATMERYVKQDEKFIKIKMRTDDAIELFGKHGMKDKERLFHYRRTSMTNVYRLGNFYDYFYGYMPPSTGYINIFDLKNDEKGIFLVLPNKSRPNEQGNPYVPRKLFTTMFNTNIWSENLGIPTAASLNDAIANGKGRDIILASEAYQEHNIGEIAAKIKADNKRIIMVAGPSSSGKTSFSHRLSIQLGNVGLKAHPIACDDYYLERSLIPKDENGKHDFECLEALNIELFNKNIISLLKGETVELPTFNFKKSMPEYNGKTLKMGSNDVLVIEGIHGLNDKFSYAINKDDKFKVYISAVTTLNIDEHNRIPTTDNREIRRMVRDARTRGTPAAQTIAMWQSVRKGEEKHIFPYQEDADVMFNSATLYEMAVLKTFAEPLLFSIPKTTPEYTEAKRLLKFLDYFLGLSCEDVPRNSLIREFIGGSIFSVG